MDNLKIIEMKAKVCNNPKKAMEDAIYTLKYLGMVSSIFDETGMSDKTQDPDTVFFLKEKMDTTDIDNLMVYTSRWGNFIQEMFKEIMCEHFLNFSPFNFVEEVTGIFSNLHEKEIAGFKYAALVRVYEYMEKLTNIISLIGERIQIGAGISIEEFNRILDKVMSTEDNKRMEIDKDLDKLGVSVSWGSGQSNPNPASDTNKEDSTVEKVEDQENNQTESGDNKGTGEENKTAKEDSETEDTKVKDSTTEGESDKKISTENSKEGETPKKESKNKEE